MRNPSRKRWSQFAAQIFPHIQIANARAAAKPLQHSAHGKICIQSAHIYRNRAGGLKNVKNYVRADSMRALDDRLRVYDVRATEQNVRDRDQQGRLINRSQEFIQIKTHWVAAR